MTATVENQSYRKRWRRPLRVRQLSAEAAALTQDGGPLAASARASLRAHPQFPAAVRRTASGILDLHHGHRLLNLIVSDRGRMFVALMALDLHYRRDAAGIGLTPGRLRQRCAENGTCSPTRASAMLALLRLGEFVTPAPAGSDRRHRELVPTPRLIASQRNRWRCPLAGVAPILPAARRALATLERPDAMPAMVPRVADHYYGGLRLLALTPALRLFAERNGGMFLLMALIAETGDDLAGGGAAVPLSVSSLARRIFSSRTHVGKLLNDAVGEGLLTRGAGGDIVLQPRLVAAAQDFIACATLFLVHCAEGADDQA